MSHPVGDAPPAAEQRAEPLHLTGQALVIHPGDRVLVALAGAVSLAEAQRFRERLGHRFPGVEFTVAGHVAALAIQPAGDIDEQDAP